MSSEADVQYSEVVVSADRRQKVGTQIQSNDDVFMLTMILFLSSVISNVCIVTLPQSKFIFHHDKLVPAEGYSINHDLPL